MAAERERPYSQFNFRVEIENGPGADTFKAGFQEVTGLGMEVTVAEYRPGNYRENSAMKITGMYKVGDVTLKRGVVGDPATLYGWILEVRNGNQGARRTVTIQLQNEDHSAVVQEWVLTDCRPIKYQGPGLNGKGTDLAVEELVLASEKIDVR